MRISVPENSVSRPPSRRAFLASAAASAVGLAMGPRSLNALTLTGETTRSPHGANALLGAPMFNTDLGTLAASAVDAAKAAGASYADVRVAEKYYLNVVLELDGPRISMYSTFDYGIRALVNGAWAFVHGIVPTSDALASNARNAVATARGYGRLAKKPVELVPTPVVTGTWDSPMKIDPFTVPLADQIDLVTAIVNAAGHVLTGGCNGQFRWTRERRVFASTEGSIVTQTLSRARPEFRAAGKQTMLPGADLFLADHRHTTAGYECVLVPDLQEQVEAAAERAVRLSTFPSVQLDVGRYPVAFDGYSLGALFGRTLGQALHLDRALGRENDASGSTFLAPAEEMVGTKVINPLLNVTANRSLPSVHAVGWDDEGVAPTPFPLLQDGVVVDYCTSRDSAAALASWYQRSNRPTVPRGSTVAMEAGMPVTIRLPHVRIAPQKNGPALDELYKDMQHGLLVLQTHYASIDHQLTSGSMMWLNLYEIRRGAIVGRVMDTGIQFATQKFWKNLTMLGGTDTLSDSHYDVYKGNPWRYMDETATAPAGLFKDVDVVFSGRRLR